MIQLIRCLFIAYAVKLLLFALPSFSMESSSRGTKRSREEAGHDKDYFTVDAFIADLQKTRGKRQRMADDSWKAMAGHFFKNGITDGMTRDALRQNLADELNKNLHIKSRDIYANLFIGALKGQMYIIIDNNKKVKPGNNYSKIDSANKRQKRESERLEKKIFNAITEDIKKQYDDETLRREIKNIILNEDKGIKPKNKLERILQTLYYLNG